MPDAWIASITSPEHGAQQECNSSLFAPFGSSNLGRLKSATVINVYVGVMKLASCVASECTAPKSWQLNERLHILSKISRSTNPPFLNSVLMIPIRSHYNATLADKSVDCFVKMLLNTVNLLLQHR